MPRGVRFDPRHDEKTRLKIKTSQIINRLMGLVNGEAEMAPHHVTAALGLLKKTLPDLSSIEMSGPGGGPVEYKEVGDKERARALAAFVAKTRAKG